MAKKVISIKMERSEFKNYWKKSEEFRESMESAIEARNWNAAALNAIHAGISANDAVLVCHHGVRSTSSKHSDAVILLRSLMKGDKVSAAAKHLSKLIYLKNMIEYESRLFKQDEAYGLVKHANKFLEWVKSVLPDK